MHLSLSSWHATHATTCRGGICSVVRLSDIPSGLLGAESSAENKLGLLVAASGSLASLRSEVVSTSAVDSAAVEEEGDAPSGRTAWPLLLPLSERTRFASGAPRGGALIGLSRWLRIH